MTNSIAEFEDSACIFIIGSNTSACHPLIARRVFRAKEKGAKLIVADPRNIQLARFADVVVHHRLGSDVALLNGMMHIILNNGWHDKNYVEERTEGFEDFKAAVASYTPDKVKSITGVAQSDLEKMAELYATNSPAALLYAMGITQHTTGVDNVKSCCNIAMLCGNLGVRSGGVNPLRGQNNVQGACDMGGLPNVFPAYQPVTVEANTEKFTSAWGRPLSNKIGYTVTDMIQAMIEGKLKALYVIGENPKVSDPDQNHLDKALANLEFLVCQDIFLTESGQYADVILPAASFAEKEGTFTNTERRVQRVRQVIPPRGDSKPDWWITSQIAKAMGEEGFDFQSPEEIMDEINQVSPIYGGITYKRIEEKGLQWPCRDTKDRGTQYLHKGKFSRGKGRFVALEYKPSAEIADKTYPLILTTDRSLYQFHTVMTRRAEGLDELEPEELIKMHPSDAEKFGVEDGQWAEISSRRGMVKARVKVTDICQPGMVSMTFHFVEVPTNEITNPALDPIAKIPETKVSAVKITPITE